MKNYFYALLSILIFSICLPQESKIEEKNTYPINTVDPIVKDWDKEIKMARDPELKKLLEELKKEFLYDRDILKRDYKLKLKKLREAFLDRKKDLVKKYRTTNKMNKKPIPNAPHVIQCPIDCQKPCCNNVPIKKIKKKR